MEQRSPIVSINGQPAVTYFDSLRARALFADADAQLAYVFGDIARMANQQYNGMFASGVAGLFFGNSTTLEFANGTQTNYPNTATTTKDFSNVDSGAAFYGTYCSPPDETMEIVNVTAETSDPVPSTTPIRPHYPRTPFMDKAGTIAGYFLDGSASDTAVLSILTFANGHEGSVDAQNTLSKFLDACRNRSTTKLIIDIASNNGGNSLLPFDFFKQVRLDPIMPRSTCS